MTKLILALSVLFCSAGFVVAEGLNFSVNTMPTIQDGYEITQSYFTKDGNKVTVRLPRNWQTSSGSTGLELVPPDIAKASVKVQASPSDEILSFDEPGKIQYRNVAMALAPNGAKQLKIEAEQVNSFGINDWTDFDVLMSYESLAGEAMMKRVIFINIDPKNQVRLVVSAKQRDFEKVNAAARRFMSSWFELTEELELALQERIKNRKTAPAQ
jgi:hypothetical protein